jgi:hypothetical protein
MTTPVILLGLGAISGLVAAIVFVSVAWSDLSLGAKAAILLSITAGIAAIAAWGLRKGLRGSAESLSLLTVLLLVVDFAASVEGGLFGLDGVSDETLRWVAFGIMAVAGLAWALAAIHTPTRMLTGGQLVAALGVLGLTLSTYDEGWARDELVAFLLVVVLVGVVAGAARAAVWTFAMWVAAIAGLNLAVAYAVSLGRVLDEVDIAGLWSEGHAVGWVICIALAAAVAAVPRLALPMRCSASAVAALGLELLVLRPLEGSSDNLILGCLTVVCGLAAASTLVLPRPWRVGAAAGAVPAGLGAAGIVVPSVLYALGVALSGTKRPWTWSVSDRSSFQRIEPIAAPWLVGVAAVVVAAAVFLVVARRLPGLATAFVAVVASGAVVTLRYSMPLWGVVTVLGASTVATAFGAVTMRSRGVAIVAAGSACLTLSAALGSDITTLVVAAGLAVALAAIGWRVTDPEASAATAMSGVLLGALAVAAAFHHAGLRENGISYAVVGFGALVVLAAQMRPAGGHHRSRLGFELGAMVVQTVGVALAVSYDIDLQTPIALTVAGASLACVALVSEDRRPASAAGGLLLAAATWVRLAAVGVTVVEAYTLPSATVLVVLGTIRMLRVPGVSSITSLSPGLLLAMVPSLLVAVPEPTSVRALLLGVGAVVTVLAGAILRWVCPLLVGGVVLVVLALVNLAPYADAIPRWVLFALLCAVLTFLGVTWEKRLRDARTLLAAAERLA